MNVLLLALHECEKPMQIFCIFFSIFVVVVVVVGNNYFCNKLVCNNNFF